MGISGPLLCVASQLQHMSTVCLHCIVPFWVVCVCWWLHCSPPGLAAPSSQLLPAHRRLGVPACVSADVQAVDEGSLLFGLAHALKKESSSDSSMGSFS